MRFEIPAHPVAITKRFAIGKHEVTFAEYDRFAAATDHSQPDDAGWGRGKRPVIRVNGKDAVGAGIFELPITTEEIYHALKGKTWQ